MLNEAKAIVRVCTTCGSFLDSKNKCPKCRRKAENFVHLGDSKFQKKNNQQPTTNATQFPSESILGDRVSVY